MQMKKRPITIALALAGVIAGTTAGIAAISEVAAPTVTAAAQPAPEVQVQAPVEAQAATPTEAAAVTTEAPAPRAATTHVNDDERMVRIPFTNRYVRVTNPTFPSSAVEYAELLPATIAYFEQRDRNVALAGARGEIFPSAGLESPEMLPGTVAYFEQIEARRIAASRPAPVAEVKAAPPVAAAVETPATTQQSTLIAAQGAAGN